MQLIEGTILQNGKYRIIRVLGQGGFGISYLAEHTMLDKLVAIKEFFPKEYCDRDETTSHLTVGTKNSIEIVEKLKAKFIKEAKNISKLNHHNIITIHDIFQENDTAYYVMDYIEGDSLHQIIKASGAMPENRAILYIYKVAKAVGYMHSLNMNHLDIKPANIMVRSSDDEPILIDFGLSKQYIPDADPTTTTSICISHGFAPIEQYRPGGVASFTPQTDIYALGATLLNMLTGSVPPHYSEILDNGLPELPASVSQGTASAIEKSMEIKKNKRPDSIEEFLSSFSENSNKNEETPSPSKPATKGLITTTTKPIDYIGFKDPITSSSEDTVILENSQYQNSKPKFDNSVSIDGIKFIDLGLSVKWANMNIGALNIEEKGQFFSKKKDGNLNNLYQWNFEGAIVPSIQHFEELIDKCTWSWEKFNEVDGYRITGPNGNSIFFPITGDDTRFPGIDLTTFGLLWTNEALLNEWRSRSFLLYYNSNIHELVSYTTLKYCPIRLILR